MYYTYILKSKSSGRYYIGQTGNLEQRLKRHNDNEIFSTKNRGPWEVVFIEEFESRSEAVKRERYLKSLKSRKIIEKLVLKQMARMDES